MALRFYRRLHVLRGGGASMPESAIDRAAKAAHRCRNCRKKGARKLNTRASTVAGAMTIACLLITACGKPPIQSGATHPPATDQPPTLKSLAELVDAVKGSANLAMNQSTQLLERVTALAERTYAKAVFDPTDTNYQRVDSHRGFGSFAVSVQDVRDFGDGIRVKLNIGNPSTAGFSDVKLTLKYGPRFHLSEVGTEKSIAGTEMSLADMKKSLENSEKRTAEIDAWIKTLQTKEVALTAYVRPAHWNPVLVTLPGIRAAQFGYLEVSIETNSINLGNLD